jgi:Transglutaminase-like enzymes, putative cysteine proteases
MAICLVCLSCLSAPAAAGTVLVRSNPATLDFTYGVSFHQAHGRLDFLDCALPLPQSDQYQDVSRVRYDEGRIQVHPENNEEYLYVVLAGRHTRFGLRRVEFEYACGITLYDVTADFNSLSERPYHESSALYRRYAAPVGEYIIPRHPRIGRIAEELRVKGEGYVDFARKAYEYVADNFQLFPPDGKVAELDKTFERGGGDSLALSSLYISLLRCRGMPARHVIGREQSGAVHVMAEFYLEGEGWIPVDVARRSRNPGGDYFGRIRGRDRLVVFSHDIMLTVIGISKTRTIPVMCEYDYKYSVHFNSSKGRADDFYAIRHRETFALTPVR